MTREEAEKLRKVYREHVEHPDGHWKGRAIATVSPDMFAVVADAMDFHGSLVDEYYPENGKIVIKSAGYWAHGF